MRLMHSKSMQTAWSSRHENSFLSFEVSIHLRVLTFSPLFYHRSKHKVSEPNGVGGKRWEFFPLSFPFLFFPVLFLLSSSLLSPPLPSVLSVSSSSPLLVQFPSSFFLLQPRLGCHSGKNCCGRIYPALEMNIK